ncbi:MAG: phytanoyl-CoA dioxygenase family protein [Fibrobacteria bacterium]
MDIAFYARNGYAVLTPEFPLGLIDAARSDIKRILDAQKANRKVPLTRKPYRETASDLHLHSESVARLVSHRALHEVATALIGPDADMRMCFTFTKTADHGEPLDWHQDWGLDQDKGYHRISVWIAVTDAEIADGCVLVLPGSHLGPLREHTVSETHPPDKGIRGGLDAEDRGRTMAVELRAGQVLILHPQIIHGSGKNVSGRDRIAVLTSYQVPKPRYGAFWAAAGMRFSRAGKKIWEPLATAP